MGEENMVRKIIYLVLIAIGMSGCAASGIYYNPSQPTQITIPGGRVQLFYSNPNQSEEPPDRLTRDVLMSNSGPPVVQGGLGLMAVWKF
jgi:hypothetical protein